MEPARSACPLNRNRCGQAGSCRCRRLRHPGV